MSFGVIYYKESNITLCRRHANPSERYVDAFLPIESYEVVGGVLTYVYSKKYAKADPWIVCTGIFNPKTEDYYNFATIQEEGKPETVVCGHVKNTMRPEYSAQYRSIMDKLLDDIRPQLLPLFIESSDFKTVLNIHMRKYLRYRRRQKAIAAREQEIVYLFNKGDAKSIAISNDKLAQLKSESDNDHLATVASFFTQKGNLKKSATIKAMEKTHKHCSYSHKGDRARAANIMIWCLTDVDRMKLYELNPLAPTDEALNAMTYGEHSCIPQICVDEYFNSDWRTIILDVMAKIIEPAIDELLESEAASAIHDMWGRSNYFTISSRLTAPLEREAKEANDLAKAAVIAPDIAALAAKHNMAINCNGVTA
ncbi:hypothetical protein VPHK397_0114 [Vibrio phage K397]